MSLFVVLCAVMALVAIFLVVWPLLRPLPAAAKGEAVAPKAAPLAFALSVLVALGAVGLYAKINSYPWQNPEMAATAPAGHGAMGDAQSMEQITAALEAKLQQNPADAQGWRMLGRTYLVTGNPAKAATAYERAASLSSQKDMGLQLDIAEALVLAEDPAQQPRARQIVDEALAADPANQKALWYQGVMASRQGDNETAKRNWMKLLEQNPPPEIREVISNQLREIGVAVPAAAMGAAPAMASMGGAGPAAASDGGGVTPEGRAIRINVKVDPSIAVKVVPGTPLFVSAREPGIPGPPLAAVRLTSDALPTTVVLSDANSMIEGRNLSSVDDVEVIARVAVGGSVATASGDLLGSAVQKKGVNGDLDVVISKVQP
jgi:cytochrome c-type biogenesis protein CcmH